DAGKKVVHSGGDPLVQRGGELRILLQDATEQAAVQPDDLRVGARHRTGVAGAAGDQRQLSQYGDGADAAQRDLAGVAAADEVDGAARHDEGAVGRRALAVELAAGAEAHVLRAESQKAKL